MNKIEKLIKELCPNGVKIVKLREVAKCTQGKQLLKSKLKNNGYPVINGGTSPVGFSDSYNYNENKITIARVGSAGFVSWQSKNFWAGDCLFVITDINNNVNHKYLYYVLKNSELKLQKQAIGAIPNLRTNDIYNLDIPIPPRAIQDEIVKILDNFTELTTELTTELRYRKQQYEYYRDKLLTFDDSKVNVEYKRIDELFKLSRGIVISKDYIRDNPGEYPVYSSQTENNGELGKINTYQYDGEYITWTTDGAHAGTVFYRNGKFNITNICGLLDLKTNDNIKYLYYALSIRTKEHVNIGMGNAKLMSNVMAGIKIPLPPLPVQNRIAEVLDNFEKICHDLKIGLPSEISLRQKQYEYYRDLLLSFNINDIEREREDNPGLAKLFEYVFGFELVNFGYEVKYKPLWEITTWNKKFQDVASHKQQDIYKYKKYFSAKELKDLADDKGTIKILTTNKTNIFANESKVSKYVDEQEVIYLPTGGNAIVQYYKGKFITGGNVIALPRDSNELNIKYLYYVLNNKLDLIESYYRGAGIQHPHMPDILEILIPLPPLQIQNKIVEILDNFSDLTNDLTKGLPAEINLRQKQYEYYRDRLLNFDKVN